jgi:hypothetical protein
MPFARSVAKGPKFWPQYDLPLFQQYIFMALLYSMRYRLNFDYAYEYMKMEGWIDNVYE